ncbi:RNA polymerase sigma factor [Parapedobacter sp. DT-150]|uniref:RNA polymerase sigma factor n=1 Tax=Parapedobacter sp. DT-150 TaxID=3396162 RepID=UPI003F1C8B26
MTMKIRGKSPEHTSREAGFLALYQQVFPVVARHVAKRGGTFEEAKDVFHDALVVYYEKTISQSLHLQQREEAYIFGVARHLWTKKYTENRRYESIDQLMIGYGDEDSAREWAADNLQVEITPINERIVRILQIAGQKCMHLLTAFYYEKLDMDEVAARFGFSGKRSATVQKFKCLQKVKQVVKEKSLQYEDFVE